MKNIILKEGNREIGLVLFKTIETKEIAIDLFIPVNKEQVGLKSTEVFGGVGRHEQ